MPYENAHAARVDESNIVREVIVIPYCNDDDDEVTAYCNSIGLEGRWLDCSYLGTRRGRYPSFGFWYDPDLDEFVAPQPQEPDETE